jgi:hypothetical protein
MQKTAGSLHSASDILHSGWVFQQPASPLPAAPRAYERPLLPALHRSGCPDAHVCWCGASMSPHSRFCPATRAVVCLPSGDGGDGASSRYFAQLPRVPSALRERERFATVITAQEQVMVRDQTDANGAPVAIGAREPLERGSDVLR